MTRRIALLGMALESNAFAPVARESDFKDRLYLQGEAIVEESRRPVGKVCMELSGFVQTMDAIGDWQPIPILYTECEPSGPVEKRFFEATLHEMLCGLTQAGPLDAVFAANHGAMTAEHTTDPDGQMLAAIRKLLGSKIPIVVTLDLHANISDRMVEASSVIIGYQTNPHVDMFERGQEAALTTVNLMAGIPARQALVRLPLTPPSIVLLTADGPYGELIDYGQRRKRELAGAILNVSVFGGFVFSDTPENGLAIVVTGRDTNSARNLATEIAERAWAERHRFSKQLTPLAQAMTIAQRAVRGGPGAVIFSDAGDNPGGGGTGNTTALLRALLESELTDVLFGSFFDPELARQAHTLQPGEQFEAVFNRTSQYEHAEQLTLPATVVALSDGQVIGRKGIYANRALDLGPSAALSLGRARGITVVVMSKRIQTADPVFFEQFNLEIEAARVVCVKSRGHFRAGFDQWFAPGQVFEIDTPGLTAPVLSRFEWRGLPRPSYPLDSSATWNKRVTTIGAIS